MNNYCQKSKNRKPKCVNFVEQYAANYQGIGVAKYYKRSTTKAFLELNQKMGKRREIERLYE